MCSPALVSVRYCAMDEVCRFGGTEIGEGIAAGIVVVRIPPNVGPEVEDRIGSEDAGIGGRDIEGFNLGVLVGVPDVGEDGVGSAPAADHVRYIQIVVGIRGLEPGAAVVQVQVNRNPPA